MCIVTSFNYLQNTKSVTKVTFAERYFLMFSFEPTHTVGFFMAKIKLGLKPNQF